MKKKCLLFFVLFMQALFFRSHAAKITVTNSSDNVVGGLRFAIANAAAGDTIGFAPSLVGGIISISPTVILINKDLTIIGPGADKLMLTNHRTNSLVFIVEDGINVFMSGIKIEGSGDDEVPMQNGLSGAIYNKGNLTIEDAIIKNNYIGAVYSSGVLNLNRVLIYVNYTKGVTYPGRCGGITNTGLAFIQNSNLDGNGSDGIYGGNTASILNYGTMEVKNTSIVNGWSASRYDSIAASIGNHGTLQLENCTVSGNYINSKGYKGAGGIYNAGTLSVEYCTIAYNTMHISNSSTEIPYDHPDHILSYRGSGIYNEGNLSLRGSLIAQNGPEDLYYIYRGELPPIEEGVDVFTTVPVNDLGCNFVGVNNGLNLVSATNILGTSTNHLNPMLGPLQNNGGFSLTHELWEGNRCIDAGGNSSTVSVDQRGVLRDSRRDIGAFEYQNTPVLSIINPLSHTSLSAGTNVLVEAEFSIKKAHLVVTHVPGYRKLKLGYDHIGLYHANENVIAGGNNVLEITLKSYNNTIDWNKIQIRPNGSEVSPLSLKSYVDKAYGFSYPLYRHITIKIPLSDFDPSIDFSQLIVLEFPYSTNAEYFKIGIEKIVFTGGATPFLWFGDNKTDNTFDGGGIGGQLLGKLNLETALDNNYIVDFYIDQTKIGTDSTPPYTALWENLREGVHEIKAFARTSHCYTIAAPVLRKQVFRRSNYRTFGLDEEPADYQEYAYPNPTTDFITIRSLNSNAKVVFRDINGSIQYQETYSNLQNGQADISFLPAGLYFLKLEDEENPSGKVFKLIKQ